MKKQNDESFSTSNDSTAEENLENRKNTRFVEQSGTGHDQNPAYQMPLKAKDSDVVGGVRTSDAEAVQDRIPRGEKGAHFVQ